MHKSGQLQTIIEIPLLPLLRVFLHAPLDEQPFHLAGFGAASDAAVPDSLRAEAVELYEALRTDWA